MPTLLHLDTSPLESSISRELTREFATGWKASHPDGTVIYRDLAVQTPAPIDQAWIQASFVPANTRTPEQTALLAPSDNLIDELETAGEIVIGVPMHNFGIPSTLKLWIDQVARAGRTFRYSANGPEGLLTDRKLNLLVATGGDYSAESPYAAYNFAEPYLRAVFGFLGITDVNTVTVSGVARLHSGTIDRGTLLQPALEQVRAAVA